MNRRIKWQKIQHDILLSRINTEIKENSLIITITDLSGDLQQDIEDTIPSVIINQGLKATHGFLLEFIPAQYQKYFKI